ncbi:MAG: hypothetical protein IK121_04220, partial [Lachnospiraceae bacterium]|nr:hypothetical protein [Lachnospiraceae bacterium]
MMTKREMRLAADVVEGLLEVKLLISAFCTGDYLGPTVMRDTPFGRIEKIYNLFYEYIPMQK